MRVLALLAALSLVPAMTAPAGAQAGDSMSGTWKLDLQRSDPRRGMGQGAAPIPLVDTEIKVSLVGEDVRVVRNFDTPQGARVIDVTYQTDGKPHEITGPMGSPVVVRSKWAKDKLRVSYTISRGGFDLDINEIWSLSDKGELQIQYSTRVGEQMQNRKELYTRVSEAQPSGE
jgi:hypothetical protein